MAVTRDPVFRTVRMREGYDLDDVDDFVDRVIDALDGRPGRRSLSADEIESYEFKISRFRESYVMDDVDDWLDSAAAEMRQRQSARPAQVQAPAPAPEPVALRHEWAPTPRPEAVYEETMVAAAPPVATMYDSFPSLPVAQGAMSHYSDSRYPAASSQYGYGYRQPQSRVVLNVPAPATGLHHLEIWVLDLDAMVAGFSWLFERLGWRLFQVWDHGRAWQGPNEGAYIVVEQSPDAHWGQYDRKAPGLNHIALAVPERWMVDQIVVEAAQFGWRLLFSEQHPYAGGPDHYAAYLENAEGFEVEVVAARR